jgi:hypothetical protein
LSLVIATTALHAQSSQTSLYYLDPKLGSSADLTSFYLDDYLYVRQKGTKSEVTLTGKNSGDFLNFLVQIVNNSPEPIDFLPDSSVVSILLPKSGLDSEKQVNLKVFNSTELFSRSVEDLKVAYFVSALSSAVSGNGSGQVATSISNAQYLQFAADGAKSNLFFISNQLLRRNTLGPGTGTQGVLVVQSADPPEKGFKIKNLSSNQRAVDAISKGTPLSVKIVVGTEQFVFVLSLRNDWRN